MKKFTALLLALCCLLALVACAEKKNATAEGKTEAEPLFRFKTSADREAEIVSQYLPLSEGYFYAHPTDTGFAAGFVSPSRSLSAEKIVEAEGSVTGLRILETERDRALLLTEDAVYHLLLKEGSATKAEVTPRDFSHAVLHPALSVLCENEDLLLLLPVSFEETLVLAEKKGLSDFGHVLGVSEDGRRIWYATQKNGAYTGIAYFEYGQKSCAETVPFLYDSVLSLGGTAFLFTRVADDGSAVYLFRDPEKGITRAFTAPTPFDGVTADRSGTVLCGTRVSGDGGTVSVFSLETGEELKSFFSEYGRPAPDPAFSADGATLFFAVGKGTDAMFATLEVK